VKCNGDLMLAFPRRILTFTLIAFIALNISVFLLPMDSGAQSTEPIFIDQVTEDRDKPIALEGSDRFTWMLQNNHPVVSAQFIRVEVVLSNSDWHYIAYLDNEEIRNLFFSIEQNEIRTLTIELIPNTEQHQSECNADIIFTVTTDPTIADQTFEVSSKLDNPPAKLFLSDIIPLQSVLGESFEEGFGLFIVEVMLWLAVGLIIIGLVDPVIKRFTEKTETEVDDIIIQIVRKPIFLLVVLYGLVASLALLNPPQWILSITLKVYSLSFILIIAYLAYKVYSAISLYIGESYAKKKKVRVQRILLPALDKLVKIMLGVAVLVVLLKFFGVDVGGIVVGMGVLGLVIAFAAQDTLSNFFSGMFLIMEPNFKEGDEITYENDVYEVQKIGMRTTQLYDKFKHITVVVPNNKLANEKLITLNEPDKRIKDKTSVGVSYDSDPQHVEDVLLDIASESPFLIHEEGRSPFVRFGEFGDSALGFTLYYWVENMDNRFLARHLINKEIYARFKKENIEIPFPQRVVHMVYDEPVDVTSSKKMPKRQSKHKKKKKDLPPVKFDEEETDYVEGDRPDGPQIYVGRTPPYATEKSVGSSKKESSMGDHPGEDGGDGDGGD